MQTPVNSVSPGILPSATCSSPKPDYPLPTPSGECICIGRYHGYGYGTLIIYVFDEQGNSVKDVSLKVEILDTKEFLDCLSKNYNITTDSIQKTISVFPTMDKNLQGLSCRVPRDLPIRYTVSKAGYTTKEIFYVMLGTSESPFDNIYFGCPANNFSPSIIRPCYDGEALYDYGGAKYALTKIPTESPSPTSSGQQY